MGYSMHLRLSVTPDSDFPGVSSLIQELNGLRFASNSDWCDNGMVKWPTLTEDMKRLSRDLKGVEITLEYRGEHDDEGAEYFYEGKAFADSRPEWNPRFPPHKLLRP